MGIGTAPEELPGKDHSTDLGPLMVETVLLSVESSEGAAESGAGKLGLFQPRQNVTQKRTRTIWSSRDSG